VLVIDRWPSHPWIALVSRKVSAAPIRSSPICAATQSVCRSAKPWRRLALLTHILSGQERTARNRAAVGELMWAESSARLLRAPPSFAKVSAQALKQRRTLVRRLVGRRARSLIYNRSTSQPVFPAINKLRTIRTSGQFCSDRSPGAMQSERCQTDAHFRSKATRRVYMRLHHKLPDNFLKARQEEF
jgi:hypothetical protein